MREMPETPEELDQHQVLAQLRKQQRDTALASSAMFAALLALPLAQNTWHGPEVAAVIAIAATALFAGQRWAIAVIVIAEVFLLPTVWPRAFLEGELDSRLLALVTLGALVPGLLAMRRAAAALVLMSGFRRTRKVYRRMYAGLIALSVIAVVIPLL